MIFPAPSPGRFRAVAAVVLLPALALVLTQLAPAADTAPAPRSAAARPARDARTLRPVELDQALMDEVKDGNELLKNLEYLSDTIGPRLTGSKQLERANEWTLAKMKEYGLESVRLEPWEMPVGWERGPASLTVIEPDTGVKCPVAAVGWTPGTKGKVTGEVVILRARTKTDLDKYKGKLRNAVVLTAPPANVAPVTDLRYGPLPPPKKDEPKKAAPKKAAADQVIAEIDEQPKRKSAQPGGVGSFVSTRDLDAFLLAEGAACRLSDAAKPHGLLVAYGSWRGEDRGAPQDIMPRLVVAHEYYAMLYRLASRPDGVTRVQVQIENKFIPGPITCFNTVGEIRGSEKPDEFVVVGAHLDSWDLATGTMDNGTGTCVVLETARTVAALAKRGYRPRRTIRFVLFTGEEQGLHGSKQYVNRHRDEMERTSLALVHDTGTGRVYGFGVHGQNEVKEVLEPQLETLAALEGWRGLDLGGVNGSDHQAFHPAGVPGLACRQDIDEYRLTHHTQTDTFDHAKGPNLIQGAQVLAVTSTRVANMPELLPRMPKRKEAPKKESRKE